MRIFTIVLSLSVFLVSCDNFSKNLKTEINNEIELADGQTGGALIEIAPEALLTMQKYDTNVFVIDVRNPSKEIRLCKRIKGYKHIEDTILYQNPNILPKDKSIVLLSKSGVRSRRLGEFLEKKGMTVYNLKSGMDSYWDWRANIIREKLQLFDKEIDVIELYADDFGC